MAVKKGAKMVGHFPPPGDSVPAWVSGVKAKPSAHLRAALTPLTGRKCLAPMAEYWAARVAPFSTTTGSIGSEGCVYTGDECSPRTGINLG